MSIDVGKELTRISTSLVVHRTAAKLTQRALAEKAGLSIDVVKTIESGRHKPNFTTLICLAGALGLKVELNPIEVAE
jgi:transcriptional regulator with XRE-family HTH domain